MKIIIYALCALSAILLTALVYVSLKLRKTEARRKRAAAKAAVLTREKRQHRSSHNSLITYYAQERFDEYERTIDSLNQQLAAANAKIESLKRTKRKFGDYVQQAVEAGKAHIPC